MGIQLLSALHTLRTELHPSQSFQNLKHLEGIEKRIPLLYGPDVTDYVERFNLLRGLHQERTESLFAKVHSNQCLSTQLRALNETKQKLVSLNEKLHSDHGAYIQGEVAGLPQKFRDLLYWAVWVKDDCPDQLQYGERTIQLNGKVLLADLPLLCLQGKTLVDQLICYVDQKIALKKQKQTIENLESIITRLNKPYLDFAPVAELIEVLPMELQQPLYQHLFPSKQSSDTTPNWKRTDLSQNPQRLSTLLSGKESLLAKLLEDQRHTLKNLQDSSELEEFDRATVLYSSISEKQRSELLRLVSPKVRKWINDLKIHETQSDHFVYLYKQRGAHFRQNQTSFSVYAPHAKSISVVLSAFGQEEYHLPMTNRGDGIWNLSTPLAPPGRSYRYLVEDQRGEKVYRTDPFSFSTMECHGHMESIVVAEDQFIWKDAQWMETRANGNPTSKPLCVYELYVESWKRKEGKPLPFRELGKALAEYAKQMHFTHVELYGVLDNKGGWGYQVHHFLAPHYSQGSPDEFKELINELHCNNIGVVLDFIPAHYKHEPRESTLENFDGTDLFGYSGKCEWPTRLFDFSKPETCRLLKASALYWAKEMHVDVFRVDAMSHVVRRFGEGCPPEGKENPEGIDFLKDVNKTMAELHPDVLMIAEDTTGLHGVTTPVEKGGLGFHFKWGINEGKTARWFLESPHEQRQARHQTQFMDHLQHIKHKQNLIFAHSHDEQANRTVWKGYPIENDQTLFKIDANVGIPEKFADMRNFFSWGSLAFNRYLMHMGDEIGQKRSWDVAIWSEKGSVEWGLLDHDQKDSHYHRGLQAYVTDLNILYRERAAFWKRGEKGFRLCCDHPSNNIIAYERNEKNGQGVIIVHNFSNGNWENYDIALGNTDDLKTLKSVAVILNSDDPKYGGEGKYPNDNIPIKREVDQVNITLAIPPMSTLVLQKII